jgi:class 3 adenylate cyclase/predicted ATPase
MRCSKCGCENREGRKFCTSCGTPLASTCPKCGASVELDEKFCGECGTTLGNTAPATANGTESLAASADGERRHLTILFCDLVGSVALTSQVDPEEWRAMVAGYQRAASEAITRFGGEVVRYVGDGIMAFFGHPVAHDNDAERAARAGLAILDTIAKPNSQAGHAPLSVRVGIDSGQVVVGTGAGDVVDAFGDAANIAARVQATAEPNSVVITGATHRLISGLFVVQDRGTHSLKGIERPVQLYRVIRPSGLRGRLEAAAAAGGLTPFVGREEELRLLLSRWERARDGEGQVVTLIGEAGIGKSRLLRRFREQIADTPHTWLEAGAGAFFQNTPFYPVTDLLRQSLGEGSDRVAELASRLTAVGLKPVEAIPLLAPLLNLPLPPEYPPSPLPPEQQRRRLLATLVEWVTASSRRQPLISVIEDLHWADPSTLELIHLLVEQSATTPLLLLYTARPEFHPPWPLRAHHAQITLNRLSARDIRVMVQEVAAQKALADETVATVIQRTGGVPLFVEELTRSLLESGDGKLVWHSIPVTLHDSLMARLDRLGPAKEVAQVGAVIGAEFSYEVLHAVHPLAEPDLQSALQSLTNAELLYVRGIAPEASYQFKHALIHDAAYEALLRSKRQELHSRIAQVIEEHFKATFETQPELIAHHYTEAGLPMRAIPYWHQAGQRAIQQGANAEAVSHVTTGLQLLKKLPDTAGRRQQELDLLLSLGGLLTATKGFAAPEVEHLYRRARALCEQLGDRHKVLRALFGLTSYYSMRGEHATARTLADQMLDIAQDTQDPDLLLAAHRMQGSTRLWIGEFTVAHAHLESGMRLYDPSQHQAQTLRYGQDLGIACRLLAHQVLWILGYPDQALMRAQEALEISKSFHHLNTLAFGLGCLPHVHYVRGEWAAAQRRAEDVVTFATDAGLPYFVAQQSIFWGAALASQGHYEIGISKMRQGLEAQRATGGLGLQQLWLALQVEACTAAGRLQEGWTALQEALAIRPTYGDRYWEAELYRLKGELLLMQDRWSRPSRSEQPSRAIATEAEACFRQAIETARELSAKSFELRAGMSIARLLRDTGRREEARETLANVYNWFTEGFDSTDLKEAKALLDELSNSVRSQPPESQR